MVVLLCLDSRRQRFALFQAEGAFGPPQDPPLAVQEQHIDVVLAGQLECLTERLLVQVEGDGPFAGHRIGDSSPHSLVDKCTGQDVEPLDGRQFVVEQARLGRLKLPGEGNPGIDLSLLPLLEGNED